MTGTVTGLTIGNYSKKQAMQARQAATTERKLLRDLQVRTLYNRPAKQLSPYLADRDRFRVASEGMLDRVRSIQATLNARNTLGKGEGAPEEIVANSEQVQLNQLLIEYEVAVKAFYDRTDKFARDVNALGDPQADLKQAEQLLLAFVRGQAFNDFVKYPDRLAYFVNRVGQREQAAEANLQRVEELRTQIILASLMVSLAIAVAIALYTSRAIALPIKAVTDIAHRVTHDNDFDLQAPVKGDREVIILAKSLNQLIQQVRQLLSQVGQKNTDLEAALTQLNQQQIHLIQSEKMSSLGQLVAGVAHEINNPVTFIHGNLKHLTQHTQDLLHHIQLYQTTYPEPNPSMQTHADDIDLPFLQDDFPKMLDSMQMGTQRIREIVLSLRNFARMDEAEYKVVNLHDGIESTLLILQHRLQTTGDRPVIEVIKDFGDLPPVECYAGQLNQVLMNILVNAIDALEAQDPSSTLKQQPPQITISTAIKPSTVNDQPWVEIAIADNGPGIPEVIRPRIFEPFFTTKPVGQGTGMGMSISYQIITQKHGGKLDYVSSSDRGTKFMIQIPVQQTASSPSDASQASPSSMPQPVA